MTIVERTSVLIPAFEEESAIASIIAEIQSLGNWKEIVVVDDGSSDETGARAEEAGARVVRHPYNKGNGAAVKSALRAAEGEFVLLMDADGQHPPKEIEKLLAKLPEYDLAVGARSFGDRATLSRGLGNGALNRFATMLSGFKIQDLTSGSARRGAIESASSSTCSRTASAIQLRARSLSSKPATACASSPSEASNEGARKRARCVPPAKAGVSSCSSCG